MSLVATCQGNCIKYIHINNDVMSEVMGNVTNVYMHVQNSLGISPHASRCKNAKAKMELDMHILRKQYLHFSEKSTSFLCNSISHRLHFLYTYIAQRVSE